MSAYTNSGALRVDGNQDGALAITPSDSTILNGVRLLYVGGLGNVTVVTEANYSDNRRDGTAIVPVLFSAVPAGTQLPVSVAQVMATGTTATLIVGLGRPSATLDAQD